MLIAKKSPDYFFDILTYGLIMFIVGGVIYFYTLNIPSFDIAIKETRLGLLAFVGFGLAVMGAFITFASSILWYLAKLHDDAS